MSEFSARVVRVGKVVKHDMADTLSVTQIGGEGGYQVVLRTTWASTAPPSSSMGLVALAFAEWAAAR